MRSMLIASLSVMWTTTSRIDHAPGPGRAVRSSRVSPATAARTFAGPASYSAITAGFTTGLRKGKWVLFVVRLLRGRTSGHGVTGPQEDPAPRPRVRSALADVHRDL